MQLLLAQCLTEDLGVPSGLVERLAGLAELPRLVLPAWTGWRIESGPPRPKLVLDDSRAVASSDGDDGGDGMAIDSEGRLYVTGNLGVHVPFSYSLNARSFSLDGLKIRPHNLNVIEHSPDSSTYYGANYEIAIYDKRITESRYNGELRGILGHKHGDWKFTLNPIINQALFKNPNGRPLELEVFGQVIREFGDDFALGVEHYSSLGRLSRPTFGPGSEQISYLVAEFKTKKHYEFHLGVGHGWTAPADKRAFKALIGFPF